jgi:hypothetical protein
MTTRWGLSRYGLLLYPSLEDAAAVGFERVEANYADGVLLRKRLCRPHRSDSDRQSELRRSPFEERADSFFVVGAKVDVPADPVQIFKR